MRHREGNGVGGARAPSADDGGRCWSRRMFRRLPAPDGPMVGSSGAIAARGDDSLCCPQPRPRNRKTSLAPELCLLKSRHRRRRYSAGRSRASTQRRQIWLPRRPPRAWAALCKRETIMMNFRRNKRITSGSGRPRRSRVHLGQANENRSSAWGRGDSCSPAPETAVDPPSRWRPVELLHHYRSRPR